VIDMTGFKYIAAVLALVGAVGSAQANSELGKDQIQFMGDTSLSEIQGAKSSNSNSAGLYSFLERKKEKGYGQAFESSTAGYTTKRICHYSTGRKPVCVTRIVKD
jgi:hypothetical protein